MGLPPTDVYRLELREFYAAYEGWQYLREMSMREAMERARWHAAVSIMPHVKPSGKSTVEMLPLPWDARKIDINIDMDMDARRQRVAEIMKKVNHDE